MTEQVTADHQLTYSQLRAAYTEADERMKKSNGHSFVQILKCRCVYCHRSPDQKGKCRDWFATYLDRLSEVLSERGIVIKG